MEDNKKIHIAVIGHGGVRKETLAKAISTKRQEAINKVENTFNITTEEAEKAIEESFEINIKELSESLKRVSDIICYKDFGLKEPIKFKEESVVKLDKFVHSGFYLTDEQKLMLINFGITVQELESITSEKELLDKIAEKWHETCDDKVEPRKKAKTWNKKKFYE